MTTILEVGGIGYASPLLFEISISTLIIFNSLRSKYVYLWWGIIKTHLGKDFREVIWLGKEFSS